MPGQPTCAVSIAVPWGTGALNAFNRVPDSAAAEVAIANAATTKARIGVRMNAVLAPVDPGVRFHVHAGGAPLRCAAGGRMSWLDTLEQIRTRDFGAASAADRDRAARDVVNMSSYAC